MNGLIIRLKAIPKQAWQWLAVPMAAIVGWVYGGNQGAALALAGLALAAGIWWVWHKKPASDNAGGIGDVETSRKRAALLNYGAYMPELLSVSLVMTWAYQASDGAITRWIFAAAFVAFVLFKVVSVPEAVIAYRRKEYGLFSVMTLLASGSALVLFGASIFELVNQHGDAAQGRIESSKSALALDAQIESTRASIADLSRFADKGQAEKEAAALAENEAARQLKIADLQSKISAALAEIPKNKTGASAGQSLAALSAGCSNSSWYASTYCRPVADMRAEIARLESGGAGKAEYGAGHSDYTAKQQHLETLLQQRAALSASGQGVQEAYRPEDRLLGAFFGVSPETAGWGKWIFFAGVFDSSGLWARFAAALLLLSVGIDAGRAAMRKFAALLHAGFNPEQAAAMLAGGATAPATPETATPTPATPAPKSGISDRTKAALTKINRENPGLFNRIGVHGLARIRSWLDAGAQFNDKAKFGLCKRFHCFELPAAASLYCPKCAAAHKAESIPAAKVLRPGDELPALDTGGRIQAEGAAILHPGEIVLNAAATAELDRRFPGLADMLNGMKPETALDKVWIDGFVAGTLGNGANQYQAGTPEFKEWQSGHEYATIGDKMKYAAKWQATQAAQSQSDNRNAIPQSDNRNASTAAKGLQVLACGHCGTEFKQRTVWQKFCSETCRNTHNGFTPRKRRK